MPEYLYKCRACGKRFSVVIALSERMRGKKIRCPKCQSENVEHLIEPFYAKTDRKS